MVDVSIVIPTLNEEKYLEKTLKSIKKQKFKGTYEIIIADGYSEDKTIEIAKKYTKKIVLVKPGIIAFGRQKGCEKAKGKIIVSAGADVVYEPNWLNELIKPIKEGKAIATCGKILPFEGTKLEDLFSEKILNPLAGISYKIRIPFAVADNIAIKADIFKKAGGFDETLKTSEDTELISRLTKFGKVEYVPEAIAKVSMRRIREWGYSKYLSFHAKNFLQFYLKKESADEYEPVR